MKVVKKLDYPTFNVKYLYEGMLLKEFILLHTKFILNHLLRKTI